MPDSTRIAHNHELDDKLHADCSMCELIINLMPLNQRDKARDALAERYRKIVEKSSKKCEDQEGA